MNNTNFTIEINTINYFFTNRHNPDGESIFNIKSSERKKLILQETSCLD